MVHSRETILDKANELLWADRFAGFDPLIKKAKRILANSEKINYPKGIACAKLNLAAICFLNSENDSALKYISDATPWFKTNRQEKGYVRLLLLRGNISESFGHYAKTMKLWLDAYNLSREINDRESEGEACNQLGLLYLRLCNYPRSLEYFNKGLEIRKALDDVHAIASSLNRIGMALREMKKFDESLEYYFRSLEIRKKYNHTSAVQWTLLGIASTFERMKKYRESLDYYEQGSLGGDRRCMVQCIMGSGRVLSRLGDTSAAEEKLKKSLVLANELKSLSLISDAHLALANHYELIRQPAIALKNFKKYLIAKESFQSNEVKNRISNIEVAHAIEKSEQEKEIFRLKHVDLKNAYDIIDEQNKDIKTSLNYASRIRHVILPDPDEIPGLKKRCFILNIPKDVIGGDFYWFASSGSGTVIVVADCTGHGVPGALMSMLGISSLEEIINNRKIYEPNLILEELRKKVITALRQKGERYETSDGMDISICFLDKDRNSIKFSGARNNLYLIRNGELTEFYADRLPVGYSDESEVRFTMQSITPARGDIIYMFTDGYADQLGGRTHKRFRYQAFKSLLLKIHDKPLRLQKEKLEKEFLRWKGNNIQTDDVLVFGLRL